MRSAALLIVAAATGTAAHAQTVRLDWRVNGQEAAAVQPGDAVLVEGFLSWDLQTGIGLSSADWTVTLTGADASDALNYTEPAFGRNAMMLPPVASPVIDLTTPSGREIKTTAPTGTIAAFQFPGALNPLFQPQNPVRVFTFMFTAGDAGRTIDIGGSFTSAAVYTSMMGTSVFAAQRIVDGASISVVPTPASAALLASAGLVAARRRRA